jgi:hypothetical protein
MSLEKRVEYGWLRREATSPAEIKDLLGIGVPALGRPKRKRRRSCKAMMKSPVRNPVGAPLLLVSLTYIQYVPLVLSQDSR